MRLSRCLALLAVLALAGCSSISLHADAGDPAVVAKVPPGHAKKGTVPPGQAKKRGAVHPAHLGIPPGHLPPPGTCKVWIPGRPPGHQARAGTCARLRHEVPRGAWLLYRPDKDRKHVHVSSYDTRRSGVVIDVSLYDADTGVFVRVVR